MRRCHWWSHQYYLRLDDWTVECVTCGRTKREPRRSRRVAGHIAINPTIIPPRRTMLPYLKAVVAAVGAVATAALGVLAPDTKAYEVAAALVAVATAFGVYAVKNKAA